MSMKKKSRKKSFKGDESKGRPLERTLVVCPCPSRAVSIHNKERVDRLVSQVKDHFVGRDSGFIPILRVIVLELLESPQFDGLSREIQHVFSLFWEPREVNEDIEHSTVFHV